MKQKRRKKSISGLLRHKKTYQSQYRALSDWVDGWHSDQSITIEFIYAAMKEDRREDAFRYMDQLRTITDKRFIGLRNVIDIVSDPTRHLVNESDSGESMEENDALSKEDIVNLEYTDQICSEPNQNTVNKQSTSDVTKIKEINIDIDEIVKGYKTGMCVTELADWNGIGWQKITKILVTQGIYSSETYDKIKEFREAGKSDWEIMDLLDINRKTLNIYTPYTRGIYQLKK